MLLIIMNVFGMLVFVLIYYNTFLDVLEYTDINDKIV